MKEANTIAALQAQMTAMQQQLNTRDAGIFTWEAAREYIRGDIVVRESKFYIAAQTSRGQDPLYYLPELGYINMEAGRYWLSFPVALNTMSLLHLSYAHLEQFLMDPVNNILDDHIVIAHPEAKDLPLTLAGSIPTGWYIEQVGLEAFATDWYLEEISLENGDSQQRWFPQMSLDTVARYPKIIGHENGQGLQTADHAIQEDLQLKLPRLQGHISQFNSYDAKINPTEVFYEDGERTTALVAHGQNEEVCKGIAFDSHLVAANKQTSGFAVGNTALRTRGDERYFYTLIKVR